MNKKSSWFIGALCAMTLTLGLSLGDYAVGAEPMSSSMVPHILAAKSGADHQALAAQYEQEAAELQVKAQQHREMAKAYEKAGGYFGQDGKFDTVRHCEFIAGKYEEAAKENLALAKMHRDLAAKAK